MAAAQPNRFRSVFRAVARNTCLAALLPALATGCSPLGLLDAIVPAGDYAAQKDIPYGDLPRQKLDVYKPAAVGKDAPAIVFFYGGSWKSGERGRYRFVAEALTRRGFIVVIPDYRLYPEVRFPAFMHDAALAMNWVRNNLGTAGHRIFLAGHSAGAHIAALLTVDSRYLARAGVERTSICGVVGLAGPYAFDPTAYRSTRNIFAGTENAEAARPARLVRERTPPFLLLHGTDDTTVEPFNTRQFADALIAEGGTVETGFLPDIGHLQIMLAVARPFDGIAPVNDRIAGFVRRHASCAPTG